MGETWETWVQTETWGQEAVKKLFCRATMMTNTSYLKGLRPSDVTRVHTLSVIAFEPSNHLMLALVAVSALG